MAKTSSKWTDVMKLLFPDMIMDKRIYNSTFQDIFQSGIIQLPFIKEMSNRGTVAGAVFFKVDRFSMISGREYGDRDSHDMLHDSMGEDPAQIYF